MSAIRRLIPPLCRICQKRLASSSSSTFGGVYKQNDLPKPGLQVITEPVKWVREEERRNRLKEQAYAEYEKKYGVDRRTSRLIISSPRREYNHYEGQRYPKGEIPLICQYWMNNKHKNDWFSIHASGKKPAFNDLLPKEFSQFADSLHPTVLENISRLKYKQPTVVQARAIPAFSCGQHLFIAAETGSGKTLAFAAPILTDLIEQKALGHIDSKAVFLAPGYELRNQMAAMISDLAKDTGLSVKVVDSMAEEQMSADVIVGTPGHVAKMLKNGMMDKAACRFLVIDEADMLLDDSFVPVITDIFESISVGLVSLAGSRVEGTRLIFVSATLPDELQTLMHGVVDTKNLSYVTSDHLHQILPHVKQTFVRVREMDKLDKLVDIFKAKAVKSNIGQMLVFCKDKETLVWLSSQLSEQGINNVKLYGMRDWERRQANFQRFIDGEVSVGVATDLAARGLDTLNVNHVINYDFPRHMADYVHRAGRVGRCGSRYPGQVTSFVRCPWEVELTKILEEAARRNHSIPGIETNVHRTIVDRAEKKKQLKK